MGNATGIASDAYRISVALGLDNEQEVLNELRYINSETARINAANAAQVASMQRMEVEGKYDPNIQMNLEIEKAVALTAKLNLSLATQDAMLAEIVAKHQQATAAQHSQYAAGNTPGSDMVAQYRKQVEDTAAADADMLRAKAKAAKEVAAIEDEQLSHSKRAINRQAEINDMRRKGIIDPAQAMTLHRENRRIFDEAVAHDAKLLKAKKEAADKQLAQEKAEVAKRTAAFHKEVRDRAAARRAMVEASRDEAIEATQRKARASIEAAEAADREANATRQKAISLLNSLEDATQRYARATLELKAHLDAGDITNEQYEQGLANIQRRQQAMAGGMNNMGYIVGNAVTGLEDFVTVLSITGFGMDGFAAATRSASNNVAQAVRGIGTAGAQLLAPLVSIGMVLLGSAIPAIHKWITGTEDAEAATRKWNRELEVAIRLAGELGRLEIRKLNFDAEVRDIRKMDDPEAIKDKYNDLAQKEKLLLADIRKTFKESEATARELFDKLVPTQTVSDFNDFVDTIGEEFGGDVEEGFRIRMKNMQADFITNAVAKDAESARVELLRQMRAMQADMEALRPGSSTANPFDNISGMANMGPDGGAFNDFVNLFPEGINDATVIDQIEALENQIVELSRQDSEAAKLKKEELVEIRDLLKETHDQYLKALEEEAVKAAEIQAQAQHLDQQAMEAELEKLQIQQRKNSLLGAENEAERQILDLALRRQEIMESGIASPDTLSSLFNSELEAMSADINEKLSKMNFVTMATGTATQAEAYTGANRMMMAASGVEPKTEEKEMIQLLKAIKDHLSGQNTLQVEVN